VRMSFYLRMKTTPLLALPVMKTTPLLALPVQRWFDMIDWHGRGVSKNGKAQMSIQQYLSRKTRVLQWIEDQERISEMNALKQVMAQAGERKRVLDGMNPGVHSAMVVAAMGRWIARVPNRMDETDQVIQEPEVMSRMPSLWQTCWQGIVATASTDGIRVGRETLDRLGSLMTKRHSSGKRCQC
jgi:hypothetical protein